MPKLNDFLGKTWVMQYQSICIPLHATHIFHEREIYLIEEPCTQMT